MRIKITPEIIEKAKRESLKENEMPVKDYASLCVIAQAVKAQGYKKVAVEYTVVNADGKEFLITKKINKIIKKFDREEKITPTVCILKEYK